MATRSPTSTSDDPAAVRERLRLRWIRRLLLVTALLLLAQTGYLGARYVTQPGPPAAPARALGSIPAGRALPGRPPHVVARSTPVSLEVPAVGIRSRLLSLGLAPTGSIAVPTTFHEAGWYDLGPTPGSLGPAVIVGHVDSYQGPGIFYRLGQTKPGQEIDVTLADGVRARFTIDAVDVYAKTAFPTQAVYGDVDYAALRLITCGGAFDATTHSYESNVVVYASLLASRSSGPGG